MATLRPAAVVATLALTTACYRQEPYYYSTLPEPTEVQGSPSGEFDAQWQAGYVDDNASGAITGSASVSGDPQDPGYAMGACTDGEIDATLTGYGDWVYIEGYGEVWRPYTTVVGVDFTPYETCGSWVWTDYGWTFACEWDWGWLPFHYGRWGWFDDYWAWQPDYEWSPAWVEWRGGGGYVGWRPQGPIVRDHRKGRGSTGFGDGARDHRGERDGIVVRDHRTGDRSRVRDHRTHKTKEWQWRFAAANDFGKPRIRAHLFKNPAEGLRVTTFVDRPPVRATVQPVKAESIMRARLAAASRIGTHDQSVAPSRDHRVGPVQGSHGVQPGRVTDGNRPRPSRSTTSDSPSVYQPTYQPPRRAPREDRAAGGAPVFDDNGSGLPIQATSPTPTPSDHPRTPAVTSPTQPSPPSYGPPAQHPPRAPTYTAPTQPTYQPPASHPPRAPTFTAPSSPPTRAPDRSSPPSYSPPSRSPSPPPSYSPPSRSSSPPPSYSPPSRSSSPPPSYSPPSRSSSSSYSPPSRSSSPPPSSSSGGGSSRNHRR